MLAIANLYDMGDDGKPLYWSKVAAGKGWALWRTTDVVEPTRVTKDPAYWHEVYFKDARGNIQKYSGSAWKALRPDVRQLVVPPGVADAIDAAGIKCGMIKPQRAKRTELGL